MAVTVSDIAKALGVTAGTVSRALRSDPRVKATTLKRVQEQATAMGYVPNRAARKLAKGSSETIWLILGSLEWVQERRFVECCNVWLWEKGYRTQILLHDNDPQKCRDILEDLGSGSADAAMLLPSINFEDESMFQEVKVPMLLVDRWFTEKDWSVITTDQKGGAKSLIRESQLQESATGVLICGEPINAVELERERGIREACEEWFLPVFDRKNPVVDRELPLALYGNHQSRINDWCRIEGPQHSNQQFKIALTWDEWQGSPHPFSEVYWAKQDFEGMANWAVNWVLKAIRQGEPVAHRELSSEFMHWPILGINRVTSV